MVPSPGLPKRHLIAAMCHHQLHDDVAARSELAQGQKVVVEKDVPEKWPSVTTRASGSIA